MSSVAKGKVGTDAWPVVSAALEDEEEGSTLIQWLSLLLWGPVGTCRLLAWGQWDAAALE